MSSTTIFNDTDQTIFIMLIDSDFRETTQIVSGSETCFVPTSAGINTCKVIEMDEENNNIIVLAEHTLNAEEDTCSKSAFVITPVTINRSVLAVKKNSDNAFSFTRSKWDDIFSCVEAVQTELN